MIEKLERCAQAMLSALLYSTAGLALFSVSALGLMATVAFGSIFFAVTAGKLCIPTDCYPAKAQLRP